jgi:predicted house-cleaning NTP pyrophosphatase (Maf/HAM1 superfamily)
MLSRFLTRSDELREMDEQSLVYLIGSPPHVLQAYVNNGEGFDRAGGFSVQVRLRRPVYLHVM